MNRRFIASMMFLSALGGCMSTDNYAPETGGVRPHFGKGSAPPAVPGVEGPYGTPLPMAAPYAYAPQGSPQAMREMMSKNIPMTALQMNPMGMPMRGPAGSMMPNPMAPGGNLLSPPGMPPMPGMSPGGMPFGPGGPGGPGMPPGGFGPGGPGMPMPPTGNPFQKAGFQSMGADSGLMTADVRPGAANGGAMQAYLPGAGASNLTPAQFTSDPKAAPGNGVVPAQFSNSTASSLFPAQRTQVYFGSPVRMKVYWFTQGADGKPNYSTTPLETPGRYNFAQGAIYRLKLTNIPGRPALELYPTLEVVPTSPRTNEFLAHNSVPVDFTEDDFKQVVDRNYIVKVIYLPDAQNQDGAGAGPGEISSAQLERGQDPIQEALRRGSILLVLRIGNIDQGLQHTPAMTTPSPGGPPMMGKPPEQGVLPFNQVPFNMPPITPGGMMPPPNQLPPLMVPPSNGKVVVPAPPKKEIGGKLDLPPLPPPPAVKPNEDKQAVPPIPLPGTESSAPAPKTNPPVVPASTSKEIAAPPAVPALTLPALPSMVDPLVPEQPALPVIPMVPVPEKK